mmetsp:Transcript_27589/g.41744  ORF Transcript_27589/g.41744 Transcript_27589/m.41744 type:complete len:483 (-) Transcript_27589:89-1537(-)
MRENHKSKGGKPPFAPRGDKSFPPGNSPKRSSGQTLESSDASRSSRIAISAPNSVELGSVALSRDLSDLSGSYHHGMQNVTTSKNVPCHIDQRDWAQAYVLSDQLPDAFHKHKAHVLSSVKPPTFSALAEEIPRIPLCILLMDVSHKFYEILRIFVDKETDSVRDVLQGLRNHIPDCWKQDYDGLLQVRSGQSSQLIHCLSLEHYDVQPMECWIAKPWSMAAKIAGQMGSSLISYLRDTGILCVSAGQNECDDTIKLSEVAKARVYEPNGFTLDHYHAKQYISFSPPFESIARKHPEIVGPSLPNDEESSVGQEIAGSPPKTSSLEESLKVLSITDNDSTSIEESHEVVTLSSYSHLPAIEPFPTIFEEAETPDFTMIPLYHSVAKMSKQHTGHNVVKQSPKRIGIVGKFLGRSHSSKQSGVDMEKKQNLRVQSRSGWDLSPMKDNAEISLASDDVTSHSNQPLLSSASPSASTRTFLFRRK